MRLKGLYKKAITGIYYYQPPQKSGIRPSPISLQTKNKDIAVQRYLELSQTTAVHNKAGSLQFEKKRYHQIRKKANTLTKASLVNSEFVLSKLASRVGNTKTINRITTQDLRNWQLDLEKTTSPATVRTYLLRTSAFFTWAKNENLLALNPVDGITLPKSIKTRVEQYCTREERELLIKQCPSERADLSLILWLGFFAGLRLNEIVEARPNWVDLSSGTLTVQNTPTFTTKDKRHRIIRMSPRLLGFLKNYGLRSPFLLRPDKEHGSKLPNRNSKAWRYRYDPRRPFKALTKKTELDWVTFHTMRHTFATLHAIAGTPLTTIARELGDDERTTYNNYIGHSRHTAHAKVID